MITSSYTEIVKQYPPLGNKEKVIAQQMEDLRGTLHNVIFRNDSVIRQVLSLFKGDGNFGVFTEQLRGKDKDFLVIYNGSEKSYNKIKELLNENQKEWQVFFRENSFDKQFDILKKISHKTEASSLLLEEVISKSKLNIEDKNCLYGSIMDGYKRLDKEVFQLPSNEQQQKIQSLSMDMHIAADEVESLIKRVNMLIADYQNIKDMFVYSNIKLVYTIATHLKDSAKHTSYDDLIQSGMIGLTLAADCFKASVGVQFGTFASYYIKRFIKERNCYYLGGVRMCVHLAKICHSTKKLRKILGRDPSDLEIARSARVSLATLQTLRNLKKAQIVSIQEKNGEQPHEKYFAVSNRESTSYSLESQHTIHAIFEDVIKKIVSSSFSKTKFIQDKDSDEICSLISAKLFQGKKEQLLLKKKLAKKYGVCEETLRKFAERGAEKVLRYIQANKELKNKLEDLLEYDFCFDN